MKNIKIISTGSYLPQCKVYNNEIAKMLNVTENFIYKRTGIETRYYSKNETIDKLAINSVENLIKNNVKIT